MYCFIVFQNVILQRARHVTETQAIRWSIGKRLDGWEVGHYQILVEEMACTCKKYLSDYHRNESEEHRAQNFLSLVLREKLCTVVHWVVQQEKGRGDAA